VAVTDEDQILALIMGLDVSYKSFVISLDGTQLELPMLNYVIHCLLNEVIHRNNQEVGKEKDEKKEVKSKTDKDNVVFAALVDNGPCICWCCGKTGHIKAFCKEKLIRGCESRQANVAFSAADDADIWFDEFLLSSDS
jgi:hypothetical protein